MDTVFYPSLLISLGPSSRRALEITGNLLKYLPGHFNDLIEIWDVDDLLMLKKNIQEIIDNKLLSAKRLNRLVDLGFSIRSESLSSVRINIYLVWDVYNSDVSAYDIIRILAELNYGNINKDLHSGVCLFIIPIMEKEWAFDEDNNKRSQEDLKNVIDYISSEYSMLNIESKAYLLHSVSSDGTRIQKEELEYIAAILMYLNIIPSKSPPLSRFNKRLLMFEGRYKIGSIGMTSLTVFKDRLLEEFSEYMAVDMLEYIAYHEKGLDFSDYKILAMIQHDNQKSSILKGIELVDKGDCYSLKQDDRLKIELPKEISEYPRVLKNWEEYVECKRLVETKEKLDRNSGAYALELLDIIDSDIDGIVTGCSLKEGLSYLINLEEKVKSIKSGDRTSTIKDTMSLGKDMQGYIENFPDTIGFTARVLVLVSILIFTIVNLLFPYLSGITKPLSIVIFLVMLSLTLYLDYLYRKKRLGKKVNKYIEEVLKKSGTLLNLYAEKTIHENSKALLGHIALKKDEITKCINSATEVMKEITPEPDREDEIMGNLITSLLDFEDRSRFYRESRPDIPLCCPEFLNNIKGYKAISFGNLKYNIMEYSKDVSRKFIDRDFYDYLVFKYGKNTEIEVSKWIDRGMTKSKYLLQYINNDLLEEHFLFITSPEVLRISREVLSNKAGNFDASAIDGDDIYTNCTSIIRLCLGVDFDRISCVRNLKRRDSDA